MYRALLSLELRNGSMAKKALALHPRYSHLTLVRTILRLRSSPTIPHRLKSKNVLALASCYNTAASHKHLSVDRPLENHLKSFRLTADSFSIPGYLHTKVDFEPRIYSSVHPVGRNHTELQFSQDYFEWIEDDAATVEETYAQRLQVRRFGSSYT